MTKAHKKMKVKMLIKRLNVKSVLVKCNNHAFDDEFVLFIQGLNCDFILKKKIFKM